MQYPPKEELRNMNKQITMSTCTFRVLIFCLLTLLQDNFHREPAEGRISCEVSGPGLPYLRGLVERCTLLPRSHTAGQGEEDTPVLDDQLRHKGHFNKDGGTGR